MFQDIERKILHLCDEWDDLKERTSARLKKLEDGRDLHVFINNVEDIKTWIQGKLEMLLLHNDDLGKDCLSVKTLLRKHDETKVF